MATTTITFPNEKIDVLARSFGYEPKKWSSQGLIDNPETKGQFIKRMIVEDLIKRVVAIETQDAKDAVPPVTPPVIN